MTEVDLERLVLPALLALLLLGAFAILVSSGGGDAEPVSPAAPAAVTSSSAEQAPTSTVRLRFVKVRKGDTPTSIARSAGISTQKLLELNPSVDPSRLRPGQTLKLAR